MKFLIILTGLLIGIVAGYRGYHKKSPSNFMKISTIIVMAITIIAGVLPPLSGTFRDAVIVYRMVNPDIYVPVEGNIRWNTALPSTDTIVTSMIDKNGRESTVYIPSTLIPAIQGKENVIVAVQRYRSDKEFIVRGVVAVDPILTFPFIPGLEERARNLFFHVPLSWIATFAYGIALWYAVLYLRRRTDIYDIYVSSAIAVGTLFALLATVTGAIWAKFNWGSFWNWDPRETSIFILLLIYFAYFALRNAIDEPEQRARISAIYAIIAFVTVPFFIFVMPRILPGLHPGAASDQNIGPVLSPQPETLHYAKQIVFSLSLCSFTLLFYWLFSLRVRFAELQQKIELLKFQRSF